MGFVGGVKVGTSEEVEDFSGRNGEWESSWEVKDVEDVRYTVRNEEVTAKSNCKPI